MSMKKQDGYGRNKRSRRSIQDHYSLPSTSISNTGGNPTLNDSTSNLNVNSQVEEGKLTREKLQAIYSTNLEMYQSKKITIENSFTCRLLDCIKQIIQSPDFDITNMQVVGRTLEVGTKIYVCRVDSTYNLVMKLASEIASRGKNKERLNRIMNQQDMEEEAELEDLGDNELDKNGQPLYPVEKKNKKVKRGRFVQSKDKLRLTFPQKSEQHADRRAQIRMALSLFKENRQPVSHSIFQLQCQNLKDEPIDEPMEVDTIDPYHIFPECFIKDENGSNIKFLRFCWLPRDVSFNKNLHDLFGNPLDQGKDTSLLQELARQQVSVEGRRNDLSTDDVSFAAATHGSDEYNFNGNAAVDYEPVEPNNSLDFYENQRCSDQNVDENRLTNLSQVRNLSELNQLYYYLKKTGFEKKQTFFWATTNYMKHKTRGGTDKTEKLKRKKKEYQPINFKSVDWKKVENRYQKAPPEKIELDDATLKRWESTKLTYATPSLHPETRIDVAYLNESFDSEFKKSVPNRYLRYFFDRGTYIFDRYDNKTEQDKNLSEVDYGDDIPYDAEDLGQDEDEFHHSDFADREDYFPISEDVNEGQPVPNFMGKVAAFVNNFPEGALAKPEDFDDLVTMESNGVKFAAQPKPVNMQRLKSLVARILKNKLKLDENFKPTTDEDVATDFLIVLAECFEKSEERTARYLTVSLTLVAVLHVCQEHSIFIESIEGDRYGNAKIIAKGKGFNLKEQLLSEITNYYAKQPNHSSTIECFHTTQTPAQTIQQTQYTQKSILDYNGFTSSLP